MHDTAIRRHRYWYLAEDTLVLMPPARLLLLLLSGGFAGFHLAPQQARHLQSGLDSLLDTLGKQVLISKNVEEHHFQSQKFSVNPEEHFSKNEVPSPLPHRLKRGSGCPGGEGNYGFNSFNFMTFTLLVFNLVANVNNNLNNNNNNANKNNVNAITQDSNNVASNTNAVNQIGVTVLPIPGKRWVYQIM